MKHPKLLTLTALAAIALMVVLGPSPASASVLKVKTPESTDTLNFGGTIELTLESFSSTSYEDSFGLTAVTCTGSKFKGSLTVVTPSGEPRLNLMTAESTGCGHTVDVEWNGELVIKNIAGTTNGTLFSEHTRMKVFNTLLNQNCIADTRFGTDIGTITAASSWARNATVDINGLIPLEGCSASSARWTGKYEITSPWGFFVEAS